MVVPRLLAAAAFGAGLAAQACPRPVPPPAGFATQVDAVIPVVYSDAYQTFASLIRPAVAAPWCGWPLVVFVHSLGGSRAEDFGLQLAIAAQGYAVWSYDVRGQGQALAQNPGHPQAGTTLWGPIERCDLAEQIQFVANAPSYAGVIDPTRIAVVGSSQGGAHAWSAAASSGQPLQVPGRQPQVFPTIACAIASDYVAESIDDWLRDGQLWSSWFVEAIAGSYAGLPIDATLQQDARAAFIAQDPALLLGRFAAEQRGILADLMQSTVPVLYTHSYHDRIDSPLLGIMTFASAIAPRRAVLSTGGHNSPTNLIERAHRDALFLRWLNRWLWLEPNEVELEDPFVLAELPLAAQERDDPNHLWSRQHGASPLVASSATRLYLHDDHWLRETAPSSSPPAAVEVIEQVIDPQAQFSAGDYLDVPGVRDLANILAVCPLDEAVYSYVTLGEQQLDASAVVNLRVIPQSPGWMLAALLTVEPTGGAEVMLTSGCVHGSTSVVGVAEEHTLVLLPVVARLPAGTTIRLRLRSMWLRESPMARQLEVAPRFHDFRVDVVHADAVSGSWIDLPLHPVRPRLAVSSASFELATAPPLWLELRGGVERAGRPYYITFGVSGQVPATPFRNDIMPIESDWLVGIISTSWYQPEFTRFLAVLDAAGESTAIVDFSSHAPLPAELTGLRLTFDAFVFDSMAGLSGSATNPCDVVLR